MKSLSRFSSSIFRYCYCSSSSASAIQILGSNKPLPNPVFDFLPEIQNPCNLVSLVTPSLKQNDISSLNILREQGLFHRFCSHDLSRILLRCQSDPSAALSFFNWVRIHLGFQPDVQNFCIVIHILVWSKNFQQGMEILSLLIQLNEQDISTDASKKPDVFENLQLSADNCNSDTVVFDMLIKAYLLKGMIKESFQTFRRMVKLGFLPDLVSVNRLLSSLSKANHSAKCWWIYQVMIKIGLHPDACTLNTLINLLCNEGNVDGANKFLEEVEEEGYDFSNIVTYNTIIAGYCKRRRLKDAVRLYETMLTRGVGPDVITYTTLIRGFCNGGSTKRAHELFNLMVSRGLLPDAISYNTLIEGYCREGMIHEARFVLFEMIGNRVHPDDFTCRKIIEGYGNCGRMTSAVTLMLELARLRVRISKETYRRLIIGLCDDDRPFAAKSLLEKVQKYGFELSEEMYDAMAESLHRWNYPKEALRLNAEMASREMKPKPVGGYNEMVRGILRDGGNVREVMEFQWRMGKLGYVPNAAACRCVIEEMVRDKKKMSYTMIQKLG